MIRTLFGLVAASLIAADAAPLTVTGDRTVAATVHGIPARLRVDPGAAPFPIFNADFAARAHFRPGAIAMMNRLGPVVVRGRTAMVGLDLGQGEFRRRATWFAPLSVEGADGLIGPGGVPAPIVRFELGAPQPGERSVTLPLADFGLSGMGVRMMMGGTPLDILFDLERRQTLATAKVGAAIATAYGGTLDGAPEAMLIKLQVKRPVRHMTLARPLQIGPLALTDLIVRTGDFGGVSAIPDANAPPPDPDEVAVVGERRTLMPPLEIGRDDLQRCSSIVFDKPAKTITLSCR